jgi:hypothetical protein
MDSIRLKLFRNCEVTMVRTILHISYHIFVVLLSAAIALSLPFIISSLAKNLLASWAFIENEKIFLAFLEICTAAVLIILFNHLRRGWEAGKLSRVATSAGLVLATPFKGSLARKQIKKLKADQGYERDIMVIGSTGLRTFAEPEGELHHVVRNCREAKIMLLDPHGEGAIARAKSIPDPEITPEVIQDQVAKSIDFLKGLKTAQKNIRLKLYSDIPLLKLAILGDYAFLRHYHAGLNVRNMPEYTFKSDSTYGGLFLPLHRYFLSRWNDPDIPEYDLDTDEFVFRDKTGRELRREKLQS